MSPRVVLACAVALAIAPYSAHAGDPPTGPIWNGEPAGVCDWPSVVQMEDSCTGTLVHPQVVIYAGHCGPDYGAVFFGEGLENVGGSATIDFCVTDDGVGEGRDYAVCKLNEPVTDVPIVPILMGCETDVLQPGAQATLIGFGEAEPPLAYGVKRVAVSTIQDFANDEVFIQSDDGMDTCFGDSGGPVMIQLPDGSWRVFGITSYGESSDCGTGTWYSMMHTDIGWFEQQVGVDLTPCHTPDGSWDPTAGCGGFPTDPGTGVGTWATACEPGPVVDLSTTCGPAFGTTRDDDPPLAAVTEPDSGLMYMAVDSLPLTIAGTASDAPDKPDGWGVTEVRLVFDGKQLANSSHFIPPYTWNVKLPSGQYLIQIWAVDNAGNEGLSPPVAIGVNEPPPEIPAPDATTGDGESSTGSPHETTPTDGDHGGENSITAADDSTGGDPDEDDGPLPPEDTPCGCQAPAPTALLGLAVALLLPRRRRTVP